PTRVGVSDVLGIGGLEGTPRPTGFGGISDFGIWKEGIRREQGCSRYYWEWPLGVGMSVLAHPQAIERLVGCGIEDG
ncbi:MAG TPA: hypothetical protein PKX94_10865, partial [Opitutales bacterium]|nr:hypothetical protein [Opitutales bacterium]